jgi:AcrR family transcriptional regulator
MQRLDDAKRSAIMTAAVRLFSRKPFHEVLLDDVAAAAKVGKGTLYLYFKNKEDLYDSLVLEGFSQIVDRLATLAEEEWDSSVDHLRRMVAELVGWARANPRFFVMMMQGASDRVRPRLSRKRKELGQQYGVVLRRGVERGEIDDPRPALTAQFLPACVRAAVKFGPEDVSEDDIVDQVMRCVVAARPAREGARR